MEKEKQYYTDNELSEILMISVQGLRNKVVRGDPLPPNIKIPGFRHRLWPIKACHEWMEQFKR